MIENCTADELQELIAKNIRVSETAIQTAFINANSRIINILQQHHYESPHLQAIMAIKTDSELKLKITKPGVLAALTYHRKNDLIVNHWDDLVSTQYKNEALKLAYRQNNFFLFQFLLKKGAILPAEFIFEELKLIENKADIDRFNALMSVIPGIDILYHDDIMFALLDLAKTLHHTNKSAAQLLVQPYIDTWNSADAEQKERAFKIAMTLSCDFFIDQWVNKTPDFLTAWLSTHIKTAITKKGRGLSSRRVLLCSQYIENNIGINPWLNIYSADPEGLLSIYNYLLYYQTPALTEKIHYFVGDKVPVEKLQSLWARSLIADKNENLLFFINYHSHALLNKKNFPDIFKDLLAYPEAFLKLLNKTSLSQEELKQLFSEAVHLKIPGIAKELKSQIRDNTHKVIAGFLYKHLENKDAEQAYFILENNLEPLSLEHIRLLIDTICDSGSLALLNIALTDKNYGNKIKTELLSHTQLVVTILERYKGPLILRMAELINFNDDEHTLDHKKHLFAKLISNAIINDDPELLEYLQASVYYQDYQPQALFEQAADNKALKIANLLLKDKWEMVQSDTLIHLKKFFQGMNAHEIYKSVVTENLGRLYKLAIKNNYPSVLGLARISVDSMTRDPGLSPSLKHHVLKQALGSNDLDIIKIKRLIHESCSIASISSDISDPKEDIKLFTKYADDFPKIKLLLTLIPSATIRDIAINMQEWPVLLAVLHETPLGSVTHHLNQISQYNDFLIPALLDYALDQVTQGNDPRTFLNDLIIQAADLSNCTNSLAYVLRDHVEDLKNVVITIQELEASQLIGDKPFNRYDYKLLNDLEKIERAVHDNADDIDAFSQQFNALLEKNLQQKRLELEAENSARASVFNSGLMAHLHLDTLINNETINDTLLALIIDAAQELRSELMRLAQLINEEQLNIYYFTERIGKKNAIILSTALYGASIFNDDKTTLNTELLVIEGDTFTEVITQRAEDANKPIDPGASEGSAAPANLALSTGSDASENSVQLPEPAQRVFSAPEIADSEKNPNAQLAAVIDKYISIRGDINQPKYKKPAFIPQFSKSDKISAAEQLKFACTVVNQDWLPVKTAPAIEISSIHKKALLNGDLCKTINQFICSNKTEMSNQSPAASVNKFIDAVNEKNKSLILIDRVRAYHTKRSDIKAATYHSTLLFKQHTRTDKLAAVEHLVDYITKGGELDVTHRSALNNGELSKVIKQFFKDYPALDKDKADVINNRLYVLKEWLGNSLHLGMRR